MSINVPTTHSVFHWRPACWLHVAGEDASSFVQGQFTNDLRLLEQAPAVYGLWLTVKGKVLADSFVLRGKSVNEFWIGSYFSPADVIRERLESHIVADDVVIHDVTADWAGASLFGAGVDVKPLASGLGTRFVFAGRRERPPNTEFVYPIAEGAPAEWAGSSLMNVGTEEVARRRIEAGIPAVPVDVGPADLPNEGGLEADAISYTKGCYLGQEVMARLKSMGKVRRQLWRARGDGESWPALPAGIFAGSRAVGELRSAVRDGHGGWMGLAMVSLLHVSPGAELSFAPGAEPALRFTASP
jgi:folate-binding protein YgfZ